MCPTDMWHESHATNWPTWYVTRIKRAELICDMNQPWLTEMRHESHVPNWSATWVTHAQLICGMNRMRQTDIWYESDMNQYATNLSSTWITRAQLLIILIVMDLQRFRKLARICTFFDNCHWFAAFSKTGSDLQRFSIIVTDLQRFRKLARICSVFR